MPLSERISRGENWEGRIEREGGVDFYSDQGMAQRILEQMAEEAKLARDAGEQLFEGLVEIIKGHKR